MRLPKLWLSGFLASSGESVSTTVTVRGPGRVRKVGLGALLLFFLLASLTKTVMAQSPEEFRELQTRMAILEQQNASLQRALIVRLPPTRPASEPATDKAETQKSSDEEGDDLSLSAKWNHGLELSTKDKDFRVHVGGRTQFDTSWFSTDDNVQDNINTPYEDGVDFRRARLRVDGTMYATIDWAVEYDFANSENLRNSAGTGTTVVDITGFTDVWWTVRELPILGNLRIGHQKEPIGFEHLVSSRFLPFMERSYNQDTFYGGAFGGFTPGIQAFNWRDDEMGMWQIGLFKPTNNVFGSNAHDGDYAVTGRITRLLWYCDDGSSLLHIGLSGRQFTTVDDRIRYRTRDAVRAGISSTWPVPADSGTLLGDDGQFINGELAAVNGPWTLQAEYLLSYLDDAQLATTPPGPNAGTLMYHGGYVQLLCFLTGEHDNYNRHTGAFDRLIPRENFFLVRTDDGPCCGRGAWQIGVRYNYLDLNDNGIDGGLLHNATAGLNWFLNPNMKLQFNYMATHRDAALAGSLGDGWIHGWGIRVANDF
jgi:phosphate-selective porin OprO/OprP